MLKVEDIGYSTKGFSLHNISFSVKNKECHILMGPSGSGKTTVLECILGLKKINNGKIILYGKDVTQKPTHERAIAYVPQDLGLFPHLNVYENICYGAKVSKNFDKEFISHIIEAMELQKLLSKKITETSGGEKKRIALARALAMMPAVIVLDEPLANLDKAIAEDILFFIKKIQKEFEQTLLYVTHNFDEAFFIGDVISVIIDGKLVQTSKKQELYFYPRSFSIANFLGIKNIFKGIMEDETEKEIIVFIPDFSKSIKVLKRPKYPKFEKEKPIYIGIRSDEVMYIREGRKKEFFDNILEGYISEIYRMESLSKIIFQIKDKSIEICMPYGVIRKLNLKEGMAGEIMLKKEALFMAKF